MTVKQLFAISGKTYNAWSDHEAPRLGASVAFYSILSFAPLLILVTAVIALVFGHESAQRALVGEAQQIMGDKGASTVESLLKNAQKPASGIFASVVAFVTLLFGASGVFTELQDSLNIMWDVKKPASSGITGMVKQRLFSFGMILSIGFLLLVSLLLSAALSYIGHSFSQILPVPEPVLQAFNFTLSFAVVTALFALMFKYVPDAKVAWRDVIIGAVGTALLFTVGKLLLGIYLGKASVGSTYGAAGSLVAVVVWIYYSAQIFFFGAEFTHVYAHSHDSAQQPAPTTTSPEPAARVPDPPKAMAAAVGSTLPYYPKTNTPAPPLPLRQVLPPPAPNVAAKGLTPKPNQTKPRLLMALGLGVIIGRVLAAKKTPQSSR